MTLDLKRRVANAEPFLQKSTKTLGVVLSLVNRLLAAQYDVRGNGSFIGTNRPYVHVMNFGNARRSSEKRMNLVRRNRRSIEEQMGGPSQQRNPGTANHRGEKQRHRRVPRGGSTEPDDDANNQHRGRTQSIGHKMGQRAADGQRVVPTSGQRNGCPAVHDDAEDRQEYHDATADRLSVAETLKRLDHDVYR